MNRALARDQSASLEDWQKLARTGEIISFYNGRDKKTGKIVRNGHFGQAVSESWLRPGPGGNPVRLNMSEGTDALI